MQEALQPHSQVAQGGSSLHERQRGAEQVSVKVEHFPIKVGPREEEAGSRAVELEEVEGQAGESQAEPKDGRGSQCGAGTSGGQQQQQQQHSGAFGMGPVVETPAGASAEESSPTGGSKEVSHPVQFPAQARPQTGVAGGPGSEAAGPTDCRKSEPKAYSKAWLWQEIGGVWVREASSNLIQQGRATIPVKMLSALGLEGLKEVCLLHAVSQAVYRVAVSIDSRQTPVLAGLKTLIQDLGIEEGSHMALARAQPSDSTSDAMPGAKSHLLITTGAQAAAFARLGPARAEAHVPNESVAVGARGRAAAQAPAPVPADSAGAADAGGDLPPQAPAGSAGLLGDDNGAGGQSGEHGQGPGKRRVARPWLPAPGGGHRRELSASALRSITVPKNLLEVWGLVGAHQVRVQFEARSFAIGVKPIAAAQGATFQTNWTSLVRAAGLRRGDVITLCPQPSVQSGAPGAEAADRELPALLLTVQRGGQHSKASQGAAAQRAGAGSGEGQQRSEEIAAGAGAMQGGVPEHGPSSTRASPEGPSTAAAPGREPERERPARGAKRARHGPPEVPTEAVGGAWGADGAQEAAQQQQAQQQQQEGTVAPEPPVQSAGRGQHASMQALPPAQQPQQPTAGVAASAPPLQPHEMRRALKAAFHSFGVPAASQRAFLLRFLNRMEPSTQRANYEQLAAMSEEGDGEGLREWVEGTVHMLP